MSQYQSRYIAYAKHHGKTPEEMETIDKNNVNFIAWINQKWINYDRQHPELKGLPRPEWMHTQFDDMLNRGAI